MIANYGYKDGSGEFFIAIDVDKCNGCGACVPACPAAVLEIVTNPFDPLDERDIAAVGDAKRKQIKYACGPCKPVANRPPLPCVVACPAGAIAHSW